MLVALCQSTCSCSCQCSTTIMKRMKQATLFSFLVQHMLIILCLSDWFASHHTLCLQEWFVQVNQRVLKEEYYGHCTPGGGWLATQFTPILHPTPGSPPVVDEGICNSGASSTFPDGSVYLGCWAHWGYISRSLHWPALTRRLLLIIMCPVLEYSSSGGQSYKRGWNIEWIFCSSGTGGTEKSCDFTECWGVCILPYTFIRMNVQDLFVTCICDSCIKDQKLSNKVWVFCQGQPTT